MYLTSPLLMDVQVASILYRRVFNKFYSPSFCCGSAYLKGRWFRSLASSAQSFDFPYPPPVTAPSGFQMRFLKTQALFPSSFFSCTLPSLLSETYRNPL